MLSKSRRHIMRRPIIIIISVIVVFLLFGTIATSMFGDVGATFSSDNRSFGYGGGGGAPEVSVAPPMEEPAPAFDAIESDIAKSADSFSKSNNGQVVQERVVIE